MHQHCSRSISPQPQYPLSLNISSTSPHRPKVSLLSPHKAEGLSAISASHTYHLCGSISSAALREKITLYSSLLTLNSPLLTFLFASACFQGFSCCDASLRNEGCFFFGSGSPKLASGQGGAEEETMGVALASQQGFYLFLLELEQDVTIQFTTGAFP